MMKSKASRRYGRLIVFALLPLPLALGWWQLQRADEKKQIMTAYQQRIELPTLVLNNDPLLVSELDFRKATAYGQYDDRYSLLIDNKVYKGRPGYHVITPLKLAGHSDYLLVNRGWVALGQSRQKLPEIQTPTGKIEINGQLRKPPEDVFTLEKKTSQSGWNKLWQTLDINKVEQQLGLPLLPVVMQLSTEDNQGGGFVRQWPEYKDSWIQRHHGYSVQWFSLAILLLLYLLFAGRLNTTGNKHD